MSRPRIISAVVLASSRFEKVNKRAKVEFQETLSYLNNPDRMYPRLYKAI